MVIDEEMLQRAVAEQIPAEYPESVKRDASDPAQIQSLRLDYRTILRIDHLSAFTKLTKLQLDNNMIEKIEHLDHLVHLEWLGDTLFLILYFFSPSCFGCVAGFSQNFSDGMTTEQDDGRR